VIPQPPAPPEVAFVRAVPDAYPHCLRPPGPPIDVAIARREHAAYVDALRGTGAEIRWLPDAPDLPDAVFVEDVALILGRDVAVLTRPGAPTRIPEVTTLEFDLPGELARLPPNVTLDGGDVLRWGAMLFVGVSARTNAAAVDALAAIVRSHRLRVIPVVVRTGLHLKSACSLLDERTLLCVPARIDLTPLRAAGLELLEVPEPAGANVLALGRRVLVSAAAPRTADLVTARGLEAIPVRIDQFHLGDGALSCLSLRVPPDGGWCV
jgi:dimethylargininase